MIQMSLGVPLKFSAESKRICCIRMTILFRYYVIEDLYTEGSSKRAEYRREVVNLFILYGWRNFVVHRGR